MILFGVVNKKDTLELENKVRVAVFISLINTGIRGNHTLKWIISFLCSRNANFQLKSSFSKYVPTRNGL